MNWFYALDNKQNGPVDDAQFADLVARGVVRGETLVWRDGLANWQPYSAIASASAGAATTPSAPAGGMICSQCGKPFLPDQVMRFGEQWVCAGCKPVYLQRLREGAVTYYRTGSRALPVDPDELLREIKSRGYNVDIGSCITRAWDLLKANLWLVVGTTFLVTLIMQAAGAIPFIGIVIGLILDGPLIAGLYILYLKLARGEPASVGDGFSGFSKVFLQSMVGLVVMSLGIYVWFAPALIYAFSTGQFERSVPDALTFILFGVALLPMLYFAVAWTFALMLIVDMDMNFWSALQVSRRVVQMHWWSIFALIIVAGILAVLGIVGCCIGIFFTIPLLYGALIFCYEDIFGVKNSNAP